jgi:hypothetical protein
MDLRKHIRAPFLASTSFAALLLGGAAPADAACYSGPFPTNFASTTPGICITNTSFNGTVTNSGAITTNGIVVTNSAIGSSTAFGSIVDRGTLTGGITIDSTSSIRGGTNAISVFGPSVFTGNISNAGTISGVNTAIQVIGVSTFAGSIINTGSISALHAAAIIAQNVSTFTGGITNAGTISILIGATGGLVVTGNSSFGGNISNSGWANGDFSIWRLHP